MIVNLTAKIRLYPSSEEAQKFADISEVYRQACNVVSQWVFDNDFTDSRKKFSKELYDSLRKQFPALNSQMVQSVYRTVSARYKTVETQLKKKPLWYDTGKKDKDGKAIWKSIPRDLHWLWKPVFFKRPQCDYVRNRNYTLNAQDKHTMTLTTLGKRVKVRFADTFDHILYSKDVTLGTGKLVQSCGHWFLHVAYAIDVPACTKDDIQRIVGIDRGLRFITTAYDSQGKTNFINGRHLLGVRRKYKRLRSQLQKRQTASARRRLKKIGHRENRYVTDMNHCISKALVEQYGPNTLFALEDLSGVRHVTKKRKKKDRYESVSWPYYQLQTLLAYKASLNHSMVVLVSAKYTSQRCPKCGRVRKENRNHDTHTYMCDRCGYQTNDDRIGAMNIYTLGSLWRSGVEKPHFTKVTINNNQ